MASTVGIAVLDAIKEDKCQENSAVIGNGGGQWFCDYSTKALEMKSVTMGGGGQKKSKFTWHHVWTTPKDDQEYFEAKLCLARLTWEEKEGEKH